MVAMAPRTSAQPLVVAGSPDGNPLSGTQFKDAGATGVNSAGVTVGYAERYGFGDEGQRAVRWDASGTSAVELGNLGTQVTGHSGAAAYAVNSFGTAVGFSQKYIGGTTSGTRAVRWNALGTAATELGNLGTGNLGGYIGTYGAANAVNDAGTAVGYSEKYVAGVSRGPRAVRWDASGTDATELGNLGADATGYIQGASAIAVNNVGTAVGFMEKYVAGANVGKRAVRWDASGTAATELGNLGTDNNGSVSGGNANIAYAVNDIGTAVGYCEKYIAGVDMGPRPVRWNASGTAATELGILGSPGPGNGRIDIETASALNDAGTAVGQCQKFASGKYVGFRAVRWDASGTAATELANLGTDDDGITFGFASAINDAGVAVGGYDKYMAGINVGRRAVIWGLDANAIDLNDLGVVPNPPDGTWLLTEADAISDNGWVAGIGTFTPTGGVAYQRGWVAQLDLLPGDYNGNGVVDAADYTVWRDHLGQSYAIQNRDPSASGPIGAGDYNFWVAHFGQSGSGAAGARTSAVPESSGLLLAITGLIGCSWLRRTRHVRS
jgi:hypothetical protein